jgi:putative protein-disulfide isomerase
MIPARHDDAPLDDTPLDGAPRDDPFGGDAGAARPVEELWYGMDPLCGWCYAFRPVMAQLLAGESTLPVKVLTGGLVLGARVEPIAAMRDYIRAGFARIRELAGVDMGPGFAALLDEGTWISNSEPPCRAIAVVESLDETKAYAMADALCGAFYGEGTRLDDADSLRAVAERVGVDGEAFAARWDSDEARALVQASFGEAHALGVTSYPLLAYRRDDTVLVLAQGWTPAATIEARLAAARQRAIG